MKNYILTVFFLMMLAFSSAGAVGLSNQKTTSGFIFKNHTDVEVVFLLRSPKAPGIISKFTTPPGNSVRIYLINAEDMRVSDREFRVWYRVGLSGKHYMSQSAHFFNGSAQTVGDALYFGWSVGSAVTIVPYRVESCITVPLSWAAEFEVELWSASDYYKLTQQEVLPFGHQLLHPASADR